METIYRNHESNPVGEIDFHIHTSNSDGENTYEEMVEKLLRLQIIIVLRQPNLSWKMDF